MPEAAANMRAGAKTNPPVRLVGRYSVVERRADDWRVTANDFCYARCYTNNNNNYSEVEYSIIRRNWLWKHEKVTFKSKPLTDTICGLEPRSIGVHKHQTCQQSPYIAKNQNAKTIKHLSRHANSSNSLGSTQLSTIWNAWNVISMLCWREKYMFSS